MHPPPKRGGQRDGAGRKRHGPELVKTTSITGPPEAIEQLKADAKKAEQSLGAFILSRLYP